MARLVKKDAEGPLEILESKQDPNYFFLQQKLHVQKLALLQQPQKQKLHNLHGI